jgi:hypothetical protein
MSFRGVERHVPDRIIAEAGVGTNLVATRSDGTLVVERKDYPRLKEKIFEIVKRDLRQEDLEFAAGFIKDIARIVDAQDN